MPETTERIRACSVPAAALLLDRSERTLQRWCEDGTLQVVHRDVRRGSRQLVNLAQVLRSSTRLPLKRPIFGVAAYIYQRLERDFREGFVVATM
jgi:hypothetical protein